MDCTIYKDTFVSRQPVFNSAMSAWGYLLLHRHGPDDSWTSFESNYSSSLNVLACLPFLAGCIPPRLQTMLHFPVNSIQDHFPSSLNPEMTTIIIPALASIDTATLGSLTNYRSQGFEIALEATGKELPGSELLQVASILVCDVSVLRYDQVTELVALAKEHGLTLLAANTSSKDMLDKSLELGFELFHGAFFAEPEITDVRTAHPNAGARLKLFELLLPDEPDFEALSKAIEPDVAITHQLLAFLNSAHFSFAQEISSVRQAVVLAGWNPIRNWLRIILLTDILPSQKSHELGYRSAHRAKFLELVAMRANQEAIADSLFLVGLFSMLDSILDLEMENILAHLPLASNISNSLLRMDGFFTPWLTLTEAIEAGQWDKLGKLAMGLDLPPGSVAESYRLAFQWADEFFGAPERSPSPA